MITTAPESTTKGVNSDPRIISPEIKVIYPSENVHKDLAISEVQSSAPTPQILPIENTPTPTATNKDIAIVMDDPTANTTVEAPKKPTWKDIMKENAGLFIAVALISFGIGFLISKKL